VINLFLARLLKLLAGEWGFGKCRLRCVQRLRAHLTHMIHPHQPGAMGFFLLGESGLGNAHSGVWAGRSRHIANGSEGSIKGADGRVERNQKVAQFLSLRGNVLLESDKKLAY
jgi:hypothetical protein